MSDSPSCPPAELDRRLAVVETLVDELLGNQQAHARAIAGLAEREAARELAAQTMQAELRETLKSSGPLGVFKKLLLAGKGNGESKQVP